MLTRRSALAALVAAPVAFTFARPALAAIPPVYAEDGIAIDGMDSVAYFTMGKPVPGIAEYSSEWNGATWLFSSAENKATFDADPERWGPQYGGYCAFAVSKGGTATTIPESFTIHNDKLYLNFNLTVRDIWREDIPGNVLRADANWPDVLNR